MSMESAVSVLCDPAVLGLEAALLTAWALAEIHVQRTANTAKEIINDKTKELWSASESANLQPLPGPNGMLGEAAVRNPRTQQEMNSFFSMASNFEALSLENMYGSFSLPRVSLPQMPTLPNLPNLPNLPTLPNLPNLPNLPTFSFPRRVGRPPFFCGTTAATIPDTSAAVVVRPDVAPCDAVSGEEAGESTDGAVKRCSEGAVLTDHSAKIMRMDSAGRNASSSPDLSAAESADFLAMLEAAEAEANFSVPFTPPGQCVPEPAQSVPPPASMATAAVPPPADPMKAAVPDYAQQQHMVQQMFKEERREAEEGKEKVDENSKQKRRPRTKEQLERCRQESARARERKKVEKHRLERMVASRSEEADRLRARAGALMSEVQTLRESVLQAAMHTVSQIPGFSDPARVRQALATAQLCAEALQAPSLLAHSALSRTMAPFSTLPPLAPKPCLREIRPRMSTASLQAPSSTTLSPVPSSVALETEDAPAYDSVLAG